MSKARRYNKGKLRQSLIPVELLESLAEVYTKGAAKYSDFNEQGEIIYDGANNWKKGLPFMDLIDSAQRHINAWIKGENKDPELGTDHLGNAIWNLTALLYYSKNNAYLDNRPCRKKIIPRIGLDIDGVLAEFSQGYLDYFNFTDKTPAIYWNDVRFRSERLWAEIENNKDFWMELKRTDTEDLLFEPELYCTARSIKSEWTEEWLSKEGYPYADVITVGRGNTKVEALKGKVDIFVDDSYKNFIELNNEGIYTLLLTRSHNVKYDVGDMRINKLSELKRYL